MIIQNRDGSLAKEPGYQGRSIKQPDRYYAAVPLHTLDGENQVIDELISFAFDTLGSWHLDVRVYDEARAETRFIAAASHGD